MTVFKQYRKIFLKLFVFFALSAVFLFFGNLVLAQSPDLGTGYIAETGLAEGPDIRVIVVRVIQVVLTFLGIVAIGIVLYGGWLWMTSQGDAGQIEKAKKTLINAAIGLLVILSAFSIVTFVLNSFSNGPKAGGVVSNPSVNLAGGAGALGACSVESVYPEPGQSNPPVPRNTSIVITFKEEINVDTIGAAGVIIPDRVRIFRTNVGDSCFWDGDNWIDCDKNNVTKVNMSFTADHKTFVFTPAEYLGSGSENIDYTVYISNDVENAAGEGVFVNCQSDYMRWSFAVSNLVDLTPPVISSIFPAPDNARDDFSNAVAVAATGNIVLSGVPSIRSDATCVFNGGAVGKPVDIVYYNPNSSESGVLRVAILPGATEANLSNGVKPLGTALVDGKELKFNSLTIRLSEAEDSFAAGDYWEFNVTPVQEADSLNIDGVLYYFVSSPLIPGQISGVGNILTNIQNALMGAAPNEAHPSVVPNGVVDNVLQLKAKIAGASGNKITMQTNSDNLILSGAKLAGGADSAQAVIQNDKIDKKKNAIIKINFSEAMMPIFLSGEAENISPYVSVKCLDIAGMPCSATDPGLFACGADVCVDGKFVISNQYRTVEFLPALPCGVNGCGETRYCLPGDGHLRVDVHAASLESCAGEGDCAAKTPFNSCLTGHCRDVANHIYPAARLPIDGLVDVARNSFDGDDDFYAEGGDSYFNRNSLSGEGDSTQWSFFITNVLDETPPAISYIYPDTITPIPANVDLGSPVQINFNELMMTSSLRTGLVDLQIGGETVSHPALNMSSDVAVGYWTFGSDADINGDEDFDITKVEIRHTTFGEYMNYKVQAGSALRDIYQNCFKKSTGEGSLDCGADDVTNPSCCNGVATAGGECP